MPGWLSIPCLVNLSYGQSHDICYLQCIGNSQGCSWPFHLHTQDEGGEDGHSKNAWEIKRKNADLWLNSSRNAKECTGSSLNKMECSRRVHFIIRKLEPKYRHQELRSVSLTIRIVKMSWDEVLSHYLKSSWRIHSLSWQHLSKTKGTYMCQEFIFFFISFVLRALFSHTRMSTSSCTRVIFHNISFTGTSVGTHEVPHLMLKWDSCFSAFSFSISWSVITLIENPMSKGILFSLLTKLKRWYSYHHIECFPSLKWPKNRGLEL